MLTVYPQTKTYFAHWPDLSLGSGPVKNHGAKVMVGIAQAVKVIDDLERGLLDLSEQHAYTLRVDPSNFKVRSNLGMQCRDLPLSASPINSANSAPLSSADPGSLHPGGDGHHVPQGFHPRGSRRLRQIPGRCQPGSVREVPLSCAAAVRGTLMVQIKKKQ